jgi:hypothetical protein
MGGDRVARRAAAGKPGAGPPPGHRCATATLTDRSLQELADPDMADIKAYKLGKRRWSYNQCELRVAQDGGGGQTVEVVEAVQHGGPLPDAHPSPLDDASVTYQVRLSNGYRLRVVVTVAHGDPAAVHPPPPDSGGRALVTWTAVTRDQCRKGCTGPVLRSIQRFGRLGRRSGAPPADGGASPVDRDRVKEARFMYLSIDEAGTHVGARQFRLVVGAYDAAGAALLGSCVSPPIRVLANNDVPTGAAYITLHLPLRADWEG